mgnify:CR=1 FL=1
MRPCFLQPLKMLHCRLILQLHSSSVRPGSNSKCLQYKAVVVTSTAVEQHGVVYKISIPKCLYFITYFNRPLGTRLHSSRICRQAAQPCLCPSLINNCACVSFFYIVHTREMTIMNPQIDNGSFLFYFSSIHAIFCHNSSHNLCITLVLNVILQSFTYWSAVVALPCIGLKYQLYCHKTHPHNSLHALA